MCSTVELYVSMIKLVRERERGGGEREGQEREREESERERQIDRQREGERVFACLRVCLLVIGF